MDKEVVFVSCVIVIICATVFLSVCRISAYEEKVEIERPCCTAVVQK